MGFEFNLQLLESLSGFCFLKVIRQKVVKIVVTLRFCEALGILDCDVSLYQLEKYCCVSLQGIGPDMM